MRKLGVTVAAGRRAEPRRLRVQQLLRVGGGRLWRHPERDDDSVRGRLAHRLVHPAGHAVRGGPSPDEVTFSFGPSSGLASQIIAGSPADVFASASVANMTQVVDAGEVAPPTTFASNELEIAVPPANPGRVVAIEDLANPRLKVAVCQPQVPCGTVAAKVFMNAGITVTPVTLEPDVKSVLSKVTLGEVDAGVVYVTDVRAAGSAVTGIEIAPAVNASTTYPIATVRSSTNPALAAAFVAYVLSPDGASVLTAAGFARP